MFKKAFILVVLLLGSLTLWAQNPVKLSNMVQNRNGKEYYVHIAQPGQTVFSIARAYGLHYSVAVLKTDVQSMAPFDTVWLPVNDQSRAAVIQACGTARAEAPAASVAPGGEPVKEIVVEPKQTLYGIAKAYGTTVQKLEELNPALKQDGLKAGQKLLVPAKGNASATKTTQPSATSTTNTSTGTVAKNTPAAQPLPNKNTTTVSSLPAIQMQPRERISGEKVYVSVMMPLYLNRMGEISTTKFDVDQRGKKSYASFEYIQFYEGILMALEQLESQGISVVLNVVDVYSEADTAVVNAFNRRNVQQSDFVIALLTRKPFSKLCELARENRLFVISPMSTRDEIVDNNPYVVKYQPSNAAIAKAMVDMARNNYPGSHLYVIHSKGKEEAPLYNALLAELQGGNVQHTFFDWSQSGKLASVLRSTKDNVVVSIYEQGKDKNRIFTNTLLNRLNGGNMHNVLISKSNLVRDMADVDYQQLQNLSYTMLYTAYLDYDNPAHKDFVDRYKSRFKTEPMESFAGMGNDIMLYFTTAIHQKGSKFWLSPSIVRPQGMLFPIKLTQKNANSGFENQAAVFYQMENFKLVKTK